MADSSFDIVSKIDHQEVANALNSASREVATRYDFKNVGASIAWSGDAITMKANSEDRVKAVLDVHPEIREATGPHGIPLAAHATGAVRELFT